jgi:hypothetical protein
MTMGTVAVAWRAASIDGMLAPTGTLTFWAVSSTTHNDDVGLQHHPALQPADHLGKV